MRKNVLLIGALMMASMSMMAQTKVGGIRESMIQQMAKSQNGGAANKALFNAIAANNIDDLVKNHANEAPVDTHFSIETPAQSIHNQKSSGRCWMFSGFNVLRSNFALNDKQGRVVEYSQDYLFFYDQLEKANLMLQGVIDLGKKSIEDPQVQFFFKNPLNDGGTFCGVADLASKYGLVPMSAQPETFSSNNTSKMSRLISSKLREYGLEMLDAPQDHAFISLIDKYSCELGVKYILNGYNISTEVIADPESWEKESGPTGDGTYMKDVIKKYCRIP